MILYKLMVKSQCHALSRKAIRYSIQNILRFYYSLRMNYEKSKCGHTVFLYTSY